MPIDPRIPLMGIGGGRSVEVQSPMATLAQLAQLQSQRGLEELRAAQQLQTLQEMQLAQQQAQREQTKYQQEQRTYGIGQLAQRAVGSAPDVGAITDELWEQIVAPLGPETRVAATTLRNKFRSDLASANKAEAEAMEILQKARDAKLETVAGLFAGAQRGFGNDPQAFELALAHAAEAYPNEVKQLMPHVRAQPLTPERVEQLYRAAIQIAPTRAGKVLSEGQSIADQFGPLTTLPKTPAPQGPFSLGGGPGYRGVQFDAQGKPIATVSNPLSPSQQGAGQGGAGAAADPILALPTAEQLLIRKATSATRGVDRLRTQRKDIAFGLQADQEANDAERTNFKQMLRNAATEGEPAATRTIATKRGEMVATAAAMKKYLQQLRTTNKIDTNLLTGTVENISRWLGTTQDPELVSIGNQLQILLQGYRHAVTGAAFSEKEALEFQKQFPSWQNTEQVNLALLDGLLKAHGRSDWAFWSRKFTPDEAKFLGAVDPDEAIMRGGGAGPRGGTALDRYRQRRGGGQP